MPGSRTTPARACALVLAALATTFVAGCGRAPQAEFVLEPSVVSACDLPVKTRVSWDVSALGLKYATVEVNNFARVPKQWVSGDARGDHEAAAWAYDGYTVTLKSLNGVVLGRRSLTTIPCPGKPWM